MAEEQIDLAEVLRELRALRDRQEILQCINSYLRGLDRLDADLIRDAFHPDAIDNHGPFVGRTDIFVPWAIEIESSFLWTHHGLSTHTCTIDGDTAHTESYVHFYARLRDEKTVAAGGGRYIDKLERRGGKWAISIRRFFMDWSFVVPYDSWLGREWDDIRGRRDRADPSYERPLSVPQAGGNPA
jgi:hypothetical protein